MQTRWLTLSGITLLAMLTLLVGLRPAVGKNDGDEGESRTLAGTWNVTLTFDCDTLCNCPPVPVPALHTYLKEGSILEVPGGTLFRGPGVGSWEHLDDHEFAARFKFFFFSSTEATEGRRLGSEEVTSHINLTGPNTFHADATFALFDAMGAQVLTPQGKPPVCKISEDATRFGEPTKGD